jgi:Uma2 family endonuclease
MDMPALQTDWTAEKALALPADGNRYEVLDGELFVTPAPSWTHQAAVGALYVHLRAYVTANQLGWAMLSPADLVFSPRRLVQPDVFVVPSRPEGEPRVWSEVTALLLAVEVLSPSTARADRHRKRLVYQQEGVNEYWIVDCDARLVERWRPEDTRAEVLSETLVWRPREDAPALQISLPAIFTEVTGKV